LIVDIDKIIVKERIRKDFGDIQELADDIQQNGLINPPVVNKEYELLAGERRLRACKSLGWKQIEIRMMDTRDINHDFDVEVSENENRKDFTRTEREEIYTKRVERKMKSSPIGLNSNQAEKEVAKELGTSRTNMQREREVIKNRDLLSPEDFADWDEGKLSTNKAFQKIKAQLAEKDRRIKALETDGKEREDYISQREEYIHELENREVEVKVVEKKVEVMPKDYEETKRKAEMADVREKDFRSMQKAYEEMAEKWKSAEREKENLIAKANEPETEQAEQIRRSALMFCAGVSNFIEKYGGYVWLTEHINEMEPIQKSGYLKAVNAIESWVLAIKANMEGVTV